MKSRLYKKYTEEVVPALKAKHNFKNVHQIPKLVKIVVNMGVSASLEKGAMEDAAKDLTHDHRPQAGRSASPARRSPISSCAKTSRSAAT